MVQQASKPAVDMQAAADFSSELAVAEGVAKVMSETRVISTDLKRVMAAFVTSGPTRSVLWQPVHGHTAKAIAALEADIVDKFADFAMPDAARTCCV